MEDKNTINPLHQLLQEPVEHLAQERQPYSRLPKHEYHPFYMYKNLTLFCVFSFMILLLVIGIGDVTLSAKVNNKNNVSKNPSQTPYVVCTQDAKQCPDGSYVSRSGPNCEFAACPTSSRESTSSTTSPAASDAVEANWKTYKNISLGISIQYPQSMEISEYSSQDSGPDIIGKYRVATIKDFNSSSQYSFEVLISYFNSDLPLTDWYNANKSKLVNTNDSVTKTNITVDNLLAIKQVRSSKAFPNLKSNEVFLSYKKKIIEVAGSSIANTSHQELFNQILSTFKFLE